MLEETMKQLKSCGIKVAVTTCIVKEEIGFRASIETDQWEFRRVTFSTSVRGRDFEELDQNLKKHMEMFKQIMDLNKSGGTPKVQINEVTDAVIGAVRSTITPEPAA